MKVRYYRELDGVRTIAALMVMFFHYFTAHPIGGNKLLENLQKFIPFGQGGVTLFFVLSGFLITRILISTKEKPSYFKNFYARRILRIFPLYFLFLLIFYVTFGIINDASIPVFKQQIWYWLYIQNISDTFHLGAMGPDHFWSLAIEEQFYLFWPLVILITPKKFFFHLVSFVVLGATVLRIIMVSNGYEVFYFTFTRIDELALGALIAVFEFRGMNFSKKKNLYLALTASFFLAMIVLKLLVPEYGNPWVQVIKYPMMSLFSFFFILYVIAEKDGNFFKKFMKSKVMQHLGKISYGLYVYHPICFLLVNRLVPDSIMVFHFILSFISAIIISHFSYILFEEKFLRLKEKFTT